MKTIIATEKYLSFRGDSEYALSFVDSIRDAYDLAVQSGGDGMPKMLNDFIFNIEVALQDAGVLDENFER
jgi:uncharacterized glyoxalase superfamily protein PhnB